MTTADYKAQLRARKAAKLGMSLEQFDAHVEAEQRKLDAITRACTDKKHQWAVIATNAAYWGRSFVNLTPEEHVNG